jgi:hypothetical protein
MGVIGTASARIRVEWSGVGLEVVPLADASLSTITIV